MKAFLSVIAACGVGFAISYYIATEKAEALQSQHAKAEAEFQQRITGLERELDLERNKGPMVEQVTKEVAVGKVKRSPQEILAKLKELRPEGANRGAILRKIIHDLEELSEFNDAAVPDIRAFLAENTDLDYGVERSRGDDDDRGRFNPWQRSSPTMEFTLPPSLRIGLFDVLKEIGTPAAEETLAEVLGSSGRAVEVAYIARMLQEMFPNKYREAAIASATDLLRNPLPIDNPNRLDEQAESYLYAVLEMYNDTSFVPDAKNMLVDAEGRLNRNAQRYLTRALGEQAVTTWYDLYKNNTVSNNWDRMSLGNRILDYAGKNPQANAFLSEIIANPDIDGRMKSFAVMRLAGGFDRSDIPSDPAMIDGRIRLLEDMLAQSPTDDRFSRAAGFALTNLHRIKKGEAPLEMRWGDRGDRGGDRGGRSDGNR